MIYEIRNLSDEELINEYDLLKEEMKTRGLMKTKECLTTNLNNDETLNLNSTYKLRINKFRNGNYDLIDINNDKKILEFQNNEA